MVSFAGVISGAGAISPVPFSLSDCPKVFRCSEKTHLAHLGTLVHLSTFVHPSTVVHRSLTVKAVILLRAGQLYAVSPAVAHLVDAPGQSFPVTAAGAPDLLQAALRGQDRGHGVVVPPVQNLVQQADIRVGDLLLIQVVDVKKRRVRPLPQLPLVQLPITEQLLEPSAVFDPAEVSQAAAALHDLPGDCCTNVCFAAAGLSTDKEAPAPALPQILPRLALHGLSPGRVRRVAVEGAAPHQSFQAGIPQVLPIPRTLHAVALARAAGRVARSHPGFPLVHQQTLIATLVTVTDGTEAVVQIDAALRGG